MLYLSQFFQSYFKCRCRCWCFMILILLSVEYVDVNVGVSCVCPIQSMLAGTSMKPHTLSDANPARRIQNVNLQIESAVKNSFWKMFSSARIPNVLECSVCSDKCFPLLECQKCDQDLWMFLFKVCKDCCKSCFPCLFGLSSDSTGAQPIYRGSLL